MLGTGGVLTSAGSREEWIVSDQAPFCSRLEVQIWKVADSRRGGEYNGFTR